MLLREAPVDPRIQRTRELLGQALMELLGEQDLEKITVQDITARAKVNRATFYAHFTDKYALLHHLIREAFQSLVRSRLPSQTEFSAEHLRELMLVACEFLGDFAHHCKPRQLPNANNTVAEAQVQVYIYEVLIEWLKPLAHHTSTTPEMTATVVSWAIFGAVAEWAHNHRRITAEQLTDQVMTLIASGLKPLLK